jgi:tetratricopeptide (TPR) repeat protein
MAHYRTALHLLRPSTDLVHQAEALVGLGDAAILAGDYPQAAEAYDTAQEVWLRSGDARAAARTWHRLGMVRWRQEAVAEARDAFERALVLLGSSDSSDVAKTLLQLADLHVTSLGRHAEGIAYSERALALVERLGDRRLEAEACCVIGNVKVRSNNSVGGRALLERALILAQQSGAPALAAEACAHLANVCAWSGDLHRSIELSVLRAELARRTHDLFHLRHVYAWVGGLEADRGNWAEAERWFAEQEQLLEGLQSPEPRATLHLNRGVLRYYQGRFAEAEQEYRDAVALVRPTGSGALVWFLGGLGLILAELGRRDEALNCFTELHTLADALDERASSRLCAFTYLAVGYARLGEQERAGGCYPQLLSFPGQFAPIPVDRALGLAALARGDSSVAQRHLADAVAQARRAGMRPELALILLERGMLERELHGDAPSGVAPAASERSSGSLAEGLRLCEELGMQELGHWILGSARVPTEREPTRRPSQRAECIPDTAGLTERELDVLRLVAQVTPTARSRRYWF